MRNGWVKFIVFSVLYHFFTERTYSQSCVPTGINNSTINFSCGINCDTLRFQVPHLKSTSDYALTTVPYNPFPYTSPTGSEDFVIYDDDLFSHSIDIPFPFCFYDSVFSKLVVGSNGLITFDYLTNGSGSCANAFHVSPPIPFGGNLSCSQFAQWYYPRASIMADYSDLDPSVSNSPADRKVQWDVYGTAPCRKFVISFYHVGIWGGSCGASFPNTFQIVLYESTGLIDIYFERKSLCTGSSDNGKAILGIQDWTRTKAVAATGKNASQWTAANQGYRFTPNGNASRFVSAQLLDMSGNLIKNADTSTTTAGLLNINFPDICPAANTEKYLVKTIFASCGNGNNDLVSVDTITVNKTNSLNATATHTNVSCGNTDGTITVNVPSGVGTAPYQYSLNGGPAQSGNVFNNLPAGTYTITVSDPNGCSSTLTQTITAGGSLNVTTASTPTSCSGASNGTITVTPLNGGGPYQYNLNQGPGGPWQSSNVFTGLAPGTYFLFVKDVSGCSANNIIVTVAPGMPMNATLTPTAASCTGVNNGMITVNALTGTAPYQYSINGNPSQASNVFTGLAPGTYFITITDAGGCSLIDQSVVVGVGQPLSATSTSTPTSCTGATNGTITVTPTSGTAPYQYSIDGGALQGSNIFTGLAGGVHNINVIDAGGCKITGLQVTVQDGSALAASSATSATSCSGATDGTITVTPTNGTAPYQYSVDGGPLQTSNIFTGLPGGTHLVNVTDAAGCKIIGLQADIPEGAALAANTITTATSCSGAADGTITVTSVSGTGPYQYSLDGGPLQNSNIFNGLISGSHMINILSASGCTVTGLPVNVPAGQPLSVTAATTPTSCSGATNGTITITPGNGAAPYQYSINGGPLQNNNVFNNLAAATYTINVVSAGGCTLNGLQVAVSPGVPLSATTNKTDALCNGAANGTITVNISNGQGTPPYQYSIDGTNYQAGNVLTGLAAGTYTVFFKDNNGCSGTTSVTIGQPSVLNAVSSAQPVICNGQSNGQITVTASGGTAPYEFSLDGVTYQSSNIFNLPVGTFNIFTKDNHGCITSQNGITITQPQVLSATATSTNASCEGGNDGKITVTAAGGNGNYQYSLDGTSFQSSNVFNVAPGSYTVTVKDAKNCTTTYTISTGLTNNLTLTPANDETICEGTSVQLQVNSNATQYQWQTTAGLSSPTIANPYASPTTTTDYIVAAILGRCSINDTITVRVLPAPIPDAGEDGYICFGQTYQLSGSGGVQFSWSPATYLNDPTIPDPVVIPDKTTQYSLTVTGANGCTSVTPDKVTVDVTPPIVIVTSPKDTIVAAGDKFKITASSVGTDYTWTPSAGLDNPAIPDPTITITGDVTLTVTATTIAGCKGTADVIIKVYKGPDIYVPSAFTPNGDGKNDVFKPFPVGIKELKYFRVYNKWGQLVYATTQLNEGWDGRIGGIDQPTSVFVWMAQAITADNRVITKKGTVTLIR